MNKDNIKMFMTNIIDQAGSILLIGEEIESDSSIVHLKHPLRLIGNGATVSVAALFAKEEWVKIPRQMAMEMEVHEKLIDLYIKYESEVFSNIILPEEKKIIL